MSRERDPGYPYGEFDAHNWAIEFDRIYPDRLPDIDTMLGWFANAIMTGYDRAKHEEAEAVATERERIAAALDEYDRRTEHSESCPTAFKVFRRLIEPADG